MSVDSYFFASFSNTGHAIRSIQNLLDSRPPGQLPRLSSDYSFESDDSEPRSTATTAKSVGITTGLKKLGAVFKPLIGKDKADGAPLRHQASRESVDTGRSSFEVASELEVPHDGYPPRQSGAPPAGYGEDKTWSKWLKKPVSKVLGTSPSSKSTLGHYKPSDSATQSLRTGTSVRRPSGSESVTEVVEPTIREQDSEAEAMTSDDEDGDGDEGDGEHEGDAAGQRQGKRLAKKRSARLSFASTASSLTSGYGKGQGSGGGEYSMLNASETGKSEDQEMERKFRAVFALPESEVLIDREWITFTTLMVDFPGWLYRVLPVAGRFFVSTNYFCFRSSQMLYKTKVSVLLSKADVQMIIPIRDLYGLKAQKAFRFGHSGLIVVIKGHEELFLEFASSRRRRACVTLLEERMEDVRVRLGLEQDQGGDEADPASPTAAKIEARIMEDLDESRSVDDSVRSPPPVSPSPMFGSTTSTFLEFKPDPMLVTCLTIGSRGDVQPYIALCKGLQAEGHRTRIATHGEYKDWVEGVSVIRGSEERAR